MNLSSELLLALAAIVTAIVAVFRSFSQSRTARSNEILNITQSYANLVDDYQQQIGEVKGDNSTLKERIRTLEQKMAEARQHTLGLELQLSQALERISVLEGENEALRRIT
jgi:phage shock protein A